jgi:hypothetical protein
MAFEMRPGAFSLFKNDKKTKDTQPDWKGSIKLPNGEEFWFDAWTKSGQNGDFISGKIGNPKQGSSTVDQPTAYKTFPPVGQASSDNDIPF